MPKRGRREPDHDVLMLRWPARGLTAGGSREKLRSSAKLRYMNDHSPRRSRLWMMRGMAIALSLFPLLVIEIVLRAMEPPVVEAMDHDPLVDLSQLRPLFVRNDSGDRWEIPEDRMNFFRPDSFLADKPDGARRIFVLGGSTVQGRPYSTETALSTWLRLQLEAAHPETVFEVVNCGGISYASYRVAKILDEVLGHQPDAIVIYTGHNEFLEDREYAEVRSIGPLRRAVTAVGGKMATVRWIRNQLHGDPAERKTMSAEVNARLDHAGGLDRYQREENWRRGVEQHFHVTLDKMIHRARDAGVPLVLCVPVSDLVRTPPFKVAPPADLSADELQRLSEHWNTARDVGGTVADRMEAARNCLQIDPEHAGAHYVVGRLSYEQGESESARRHLTLARDHDVCPLRATTAIMQSVIDLARDNEVPLISTHILLDRRDWRNGRVSDGIPDPVSFVDHLHPSVGGHQLIGRAIAEKLIEIDWIQPGDSETRERYETLAEQHLAGLGDEYWVRGQQRLEGLRIWAAGRVQNQ